MINLIEIHTKPCIFCKKSHILRVDPIGYNKWRSGTLTQDALPNMSKDEREMLITGTCPTCWDKYMKDF